MTSISAPLNIKYSIKPVLFKEDDNESGVNPSVNGLFNNSGCLFNAKSASVKSLSQIAFNNLY